MPDLLHTLSENDYGFYKIVAEAWGVELNAPDAQTALKTLVKSLLQPTLLQEMVDSLPPEYFAALEALIENGGRMPWAVFCRRFGELRTIGAGRRDRERPDLSPSSATEFLWYRALIGKAFLKTPPEPQEYAYIPSEFLDYLQPFSQAAPHPLGRPASSAECQFTLPVNDGILDDACTLLAGLRVNLPPVSIPLRPWKIQPETLLWLLKTAGVVDPSNMPVPDAARTFLEAPRAKALLLLAQAWLQSPSFNDLLLLPGLVFEGAIQNHPLETRTKMLDWLGRLPDGQWWHLPAFIGAIKEQEPDFQRPAGDYDSWFIRHEQSTVYLRGFSTWDEVDGALIRSMICGAMHWLGLVDLAAPDAASPPTAFRLSGWAKALLGNQPPAGLAPEKGQFKVTSTGQVIAPRLVPRSTRYQVARFCEWVGETETEYHYQLRPSTLERARQQGLKTSHLVSVMRLHSAVPLPPMLLHALEQWEKFGTQAQVGKVSLLRVTSPEIITALRKSRASRHLGEALSPTAVLILPGGEAAILAALTECGYLAEARLEV